MANAAIKLDSTYENPFLAHATMEPMNCTVHVTPDGCDIWVGTQIPSIAQLVVSQGARPAAREGAHPQSSARRRLRAPARVRLHPAGGAVLPSKSKDPVKVIWSREEDIQQDMYRPYYYDRISAGLDDKGKIVAWKHRIVGSSIMARFAPPAFKDDLDFDAVEGAIDLNYDLPNMYVDYVREEPFAHSDRVLAWRRTDAQRLRRRGLHRRACGCGQERSGRVPPPLLGKVAACAACDGACRGNLRLGHAARTAQGPRHLRA